MRGVAAQRIVRAIRKPRNKADEAIAPKPGRDGAFRATCFVARLANRARRSAEEGPFGDPTAKARTCDRSDNAPHPAPGSPPLATLAESCSARRGRPAIGIALLRASHPGNAPSRPRGAYSEVP